MYRVFLNDVSIPFYSERGGILFPSAFFLKKKPSKVFILFQINLTLSELSLEIISENVKLLW